MQVLFFTVHISWRGGCSHLTAGCVMKWRHAVLLYLPAPLSLFIMLLKVYVWMNLINILQKHENRQLMQASFITAREALLSDLNSSWTIFPMQYSLLCSDSERWGRSRHRYGSSKDTCMLARHRCLMLCLMLEAISDHFVKEAVSFSFRTSFLFNELLRMNISRS